jgi:DNA-directed RNA polymerase specialized sigma24 family protein
MDGVPEGFEEFHRAMLGPLVGACALVTLDPGRATDLAEGALARVVARWGHVHGDRHGTVLAYREAMRACRRELRGPGRLGADAPAAGAALDPAVAAALRNLGPDERIAVVLRDWAGLELDDVARIVRRRPGPVAELLGSARDRLRAALPGAVHAPRPAS